MTLFNPEDNRAMIARIQALSPSAQRQWGKMDVAQMLAHCVQPMKIAFREVKTQRAWIGFLFGAMAKKRFITQSNDFDKDLPTSPAFLQKEPQDFATQQALLIQYVQRWPELGPEGITTDSHPFFGKMSADEWDKLTIKHLDHHLRQFSA